jgi:hypothetical protein
LFANPSNWGQYYLRSHFTAVVGIFQGACSENEVRQALARVREPVPRWVWVRNRAVALIGNGSSFSYSVAKSKEKDVRYNLRVLETFGFNFELDFDPTPFKTWAKMAARINASAWEFRDAVAEGLKAEGHILEFVSDSDLDISGAIKVIRQHSQVEEAVKVSEAQELTREEYENYPTKNASVTKLRPSGLLRKNTNYTSGTGSRLHLSSDSSIRTNGMAKSSFITTSLIMLTT